MQYCSELQWLGQSHLIISKLSLEIGPYRSYVAALMRMKQTIQYCTANHTEPPYNAAVAAIGPLHDMYWILVNND
jgi:hypothetical protein